MNEIIKLVAKKAGISEAVAAIAVQTVFSFLKTKLPAPIGSALDAYLGAGSGSILPKSTTTTKKTTASKSAKKTTTAKKTTSAKDDNPLGGLTDIIGGLGGLLGKK